MQTGDHLSDRQSVHSHSVAAHWLARTDDDHPKERHQDAPGLSAPTGAALDPLMPGDTYHLAVAPESLMPGDMDHLAALDFPTPGDTYHLESADGPGPFPLRAGLTGQRMMPDDTEQVRFQAGTLLPDRRAGPDVDQLLSHSGRLAALEHSDPPGGQATHYELAGLTHLSLAAAEVIGRLCSVGAAYPNFR